MSIADRTQCMTTRTDDVLIVGSGLAGLACALSLAPKSVALITKTQGLVGGSSLFAQGGIAAAVGPGDSSEAHAEDTLTCGAGLSNPDRARGLTAEGAASLQWLIDEGIEFDRDLDGALALSREAAHRFPRVVHAGGDSTGSIMTGSLARRVAATPSIRVLEKTFAYDLVVRNGRVCGLVTHSQRDGWVYHQAPAIVLATGGAGMAWWHTTNPVEATGDGMAMAARAGARLADLEFVQFHPTALDVRGSNDGARLPLLTEALRGAGALLLDDAGERFMLSEHPDAELAPRDIVARAIHKQSRAGGQVFLDIRPVLENGDADKFPRAIELAKHMGYDPHNEPLPVTPAAHFQMGGVEVDEQARTSIPGLWCCGETATTGIHGANRLASNSLLEALVFARRAAKGILAGKNPPSRAAPPPKPPAIPQRAAAGRIDALVAEARQLMSNNVGIVRAGDGLSDALKRLIEIDNEFGGLAISSDDADAVRHWGEARNVLLLARLVTSAALHRTESRGAHFRSDYPKALTARRYPQVLTAEGLIAG